MTGAKQQNSPTNKLVGLELLRFLAGIAVLVWHYSIFSYVGREQVNFEAVRQPFYSFFYFFYSSGFWAVEVFWCISGFIFFWKYRAPISERAVNFGNFFILRLSRLYPLHFATLLVVAVLQHLYWRERQSYFYFPFNSVNDFTLQIFMVANRAINQDSFNYPVWSVSVELWIYLLFFITVRFISISVLTNLLVIGACLWAEHRGMTNPLIECAKLFYVGGIAAILRRRITSARLATAAALCAWVIGLFLARWLWRTYGNQPNTFMSIFSCTAAPIFLFCLSYIPRLPTIVEKTIEGAGNLTYSSYLLHFPIQILIALLCTYGGWSIPLYEPVFFIGFVGGTLFMAHLVYRYFEMPAQRTLRRIKIVVEKA